MRVITTADELQQQWGGVFVPTMGALHAGHAVLIRCARQLSSDVSALNPPSLQGGIVGGGVGGAQNVVSTSVPSSQCIPVLVSIFVNPTQFAPGEDFTRYPRTPEADLALCESAGADVVFIPPPSVIYPADEKVFAPPLPPVATQPQLEDAARPTHFLGVCQVVSRLFDLTQPRLAVFGEKDYQQLAVIRAMTAQQQRDHRRWPSLQIIAHPTIREPHGLALSSRNRYLKPDERERALALSRALHAARDVQPWSADAAERAMRTILESHFLTIDYAVVRDSETLLPLTPSAPSGRALIAARLGSVRLIDNAAVP